MQPRERLGRIAQRQSAALQSPENAGEWANEWATESGGQKIFPSSTHRATEARATPNARMGPL